MAKSNKILQSSSQQLLFHVEDVLGMAQIRAEKFTLNLSEFNLEKAVEEVISIQKDKADDQGVELSCAVQVVGEHFEPMTDKIIIKTD